MTLKTRTALMMLLLSTAYTIQANMFEGLSSWWSNNKEIVSKEQVLTPNSTFALENTIGNITIKTWKQSKLVIEAVKKGSKEGIDATNITTHYTKDGASVKTVHNSSQTKCKVDYTVLLPHTTTITLAHTDSGNIKIKNSSKPIKAQTYKGSITFENITSSAHANTKHGNIRIHAKNLKKQHKVLAISGKGNIKLELPPKTAAKLYARTQKGKVTSDQPVTLAERTMQISQKTVADLRKDVKGFIVSENGATIKLHTSSGNVKLIEA